MRIQWNPSNTETLGTNILSWFVRCPYFRGKIYIKLGLSQVSWLSRVSLFQRCP